MKTIATTVSNRELSVTLDLFEGRALTDDQKRKIQRDVGDYLVEQTLLYVGDSKSPVEGESWQKKLSPEYKSRKLEEIGTDVADMQFTGRTLDQLKWLTAFEGIRIGVFGERAPAADGHNNLSGESRLERRRYLPDVGQSYKQSIRVEVERIISDVVATTVRPREFIGPLSQVSTKGELYTGLRTLLGDMSRSELRLAALRNPRILLYLEDNELLDFL